MHVRATDTQPMALCGMWATAIATVLPRAIYRRPIAMRVEVTGGTASVCLRPTVRYRIPAPHAAGMAASRDRDVGAHRGLSHQAEPSAPPLPGRY